jgi:hypothetical protein
VPGRVPGPVDPDKAQAFRRAAALFAHWWRDDTAGVMAVLGELEIHGLDVTRLVCGLLDVGTNLLRAAREGDEATYIEFVLREASLDEAQARPR